VLFVIWVKSSLCLFVFMHIHIILLLDLCTIICKSLSLEVNCWSFIYHHPWSFTIPCLGLFFLGLCTSLLFEFCKFYYYWSFIIIINFQKKFIVTLLLEICRLFLFMQMINDAKANIATSFLVFFITMLWLMYPFWSFSF
jgi:hypothetical protein